MYQKATKEFFNQAIKAIEKRQHLTLETNFRDDNLMEVIAEFRRFGYTINMIYLTLESIRHSIDRVNERVLNGGHYVDQNNIEQNFDLGLESLEKFAGQFDNLEINGHTQNTYTFAAYADAAHTQPFSVASNLTVNYKIATTVTYSSGSPAPTTTNTNQTIVISAGTGQVSTGQIDVYYCTGSSSVASVQSASVQSSQTVSTGASTNVVTPGTTICTSSVVTLLAGTGYQIGGDVE